MTVSVLDLLRVGIGPSSSHTVAPMSAARSFAGELEGRAFDRVSLTFHGSLGSTGPGHGTGDAALFGLAGWQAVDIDVATARDQREDARRRGVVLVAGSGERPFDPERDLVFDPAPGRTGHPNEMVFRAYCSGELVHEAVWLSTGGGFLNRHPEPESERGEGPAAPHPFRSGSELLALCDRYGLSVLGVARGNESAWHGEEALDAGLRTIGRAMSDCLDAGLREEGTLPGVLGVRRRAAVLHRRLLDARAAGEQVESMEWLGVWALAVSEQNAAGGRVVTAPTNGAAGVIPAVLRFAREMLGARERAQHELLIVAAAVGSILKETASISGAQLGCQGEIGSAAAMAAAGLASVMGGTPQQVLNAAEIALEHHLGLTCDPVAGLVQVPCIERNAVGALKALQAARLAVRGDGTQRVSLDEAIDAMNQIGADMSSKYRETALGGLALSVTVC